PDVPWREEEWYEPREVQAQISKLAQATRIRVGVPPFDRTVSGANALEYVTGDRRREIEQAIAQIEALRKQANVRRVQDKDAAEFNDRVSNLRTILRQHRGELLYALLRTGDPQAPVLVAEEINRQVRQGQHMAVELMKYLYTASYD